MRNYALALLLFTIPTLCFAQTAADIQKAKAKVKAYLLKGLNNPGSYQSASWGKLTKTYSTFEYSNEGMKLSDSISYYKRKRDDAEEFARSTRVNSVLDYRTDSTYIYYIDLEKKMDAAYKAVIIKRTQKEKAFKSVFDGFTIDHSFRARNRFNALILQNWYFEFDKNLKITAAGDNDELEERKKELEAKLEALERKYQ